jgi:hypothetical protein
MTSQGEHNDATLVKGAMSPSFIINDLIGMWYFQRLRDRELRDLTKWVGAPPSFHEMFPAADWRVRASATLDWWEQLCNQTLQEPTCGSGWRGPFEQARTLIAEAAKSGYAPSIPIHERHASEFSGFLNLRAGDSVTPLTKQFGTPDQKTPRANTTSYDFFDETVEVTFRNKTGEVSSVTVKQQKGVSAVRAAKIDDARLQWIGKTRGDVIAAFGQAWDVTADNYKYFFATPEGRRSHVTFVCYDHDKFVCSEVSVFWGQK